MSDQDFPEDFKKAIRSAVSSGYKGYKARHKDANLQDPHDLINCIAGSVMTMLMQHGHDLAELGLALKMEQLQRELKAACRARNKMIKAHEILAVRLGIWGKKGSTLGDDAWFIWVDRQPAWDGYLPQKEFQEHPVGEKEYTGFVYSTRNEDKALSFVSEEAARKCIDIFVHPYLRPYCTPTQRKEL